MGRGGPGRPPGHVTTREELEIYVWRSRGAIGRDLATPGAPSRPDARSRRAIVRECDLRWWGRG